METSAKTAMNVNELFLAIGELPSFPNNLEGDYWLNKKLFHDHIP
jgi:hypothetical protein